MSSAPSIIQELSTVLTMGAAAYLAMGRVWRLKNVLARVILGLPLAAMVLACALGSLVLAASHAFGPPAFLQWFRVMPC
jgi:hypothetical protein